MKLAWQVLMERQSEVTMSNEDMFFLVMQLISASEPGCHHFAWSMQNRMNRLPRGENKR